jgi:hypothetical protein
VLLDMPIPDDGEHPTRTIRDTVLRSLEQDGGEPADLVTVPVLRRLFELYDGRAFGGLLSQALPDGSPGMPQMRVSNRMTRTAGKTTCRQERRSALTLRRTASIEIAVSAPLLRAPIDRDVGVLVSGVRCFDQLDALQRVFEHELVHVLMFCLGWEPGCSTPTFREVASGLFGHRESKHRIELEPPAWRLRGATGDAVAIRPGDRVRFEHRGTRHEGFVNRITKRATVLVEDPRGTRYSDGGRYAKYYVPLSLLEKLA